jgi:chromosome segregation ATPase
MTEKLTPEAFVECCRRCRPTKHLHGWSARELGEMVDALRAELAQVTTQCDTYERYWQAAEKRADAAEECLARLREALADTEADRDRLREALEGCEAKFRDLHDLAVKLYAALK